MSASHRNEVPPADAVEAFLKSLFSREADQQQENTHLPKSKKKVNFVKTFLTTADGSQGLMSMVEASPENQQSHTEKVRSRTRQSYQSPSREGKVTITAHVDPELKDALTNLAEQSNLTFNEFVTSLFKRAVASPSQQTDQTLHLSEEALEKTREVEKALRSLTNTLASRSR